MQRRSVLIPLALVGSFGIALTPTLAEAATPAASASSAHAFVKSAASLAQAAGARTFTSPASSSKLVRTLDATSTTTPNPNLAVALQAQETSALGVELTVDVTGLTTGTAQLDIKWGDVSEIFQTVDAGATEPLKFQHAYGYSGPETITVTVDDGSGDTATNSVAVQTLGSEFTAFGPWRMLDTRKGIGAAAAPVAPHGTLKLKVAGVGVSDGAQKSSTPVGVTAVVMNVTATGGTANGVLTVYGDEDQSGKASTRPITSNVNYAKNKNVPNLVVVPVGKNGLIDFYNNSSGSTGIVADIQGYFTDANADAYFPVTPTRIIDTRKGIGTGKIARIPANGTIYVTVSGIKGGVIPFDAAAVAVNLTAVDATHPGVITAYSTSNPSGTGPIPSASNLNYAAGAASANAAIVPISFESPTIGQIAIHNSGAGPVDIIADASGYFTGTPSPAGGSAYVPLSGPIRILDTRSTGGPIQAGLPQSEPFPVAASDSPALPTAAIFNATVTQPTGNGYLSLYPYSPMVPAALNPTSNLNYTAGQTIANLAFLAPGTNGYAIYLGGNGSAQVIMDWFGYFENQ
ncbi:hypothetical protein KDL01_03175 [Actinospica durhamensis]|uniref:Uncharacterized protein n=1 Tax=Actinospica durhamensis TaxID=1508375 RepID=A0A941IPS8_9ACTN|nr:hypothetical protein [Actinospica durhamensis]MBR7832243.1 hypothetical protein [Actinospica durhamensis]